MRTQLGGVGDAILLQPPVFTVAGQLVFGFRCRWPIEPTRVKRPHDAVTDLQPGDARPGCDDLAGAVAHRHTGPRSRQKAHQIEVVVKVKARGPHPDKNLPCTGFVDRPVHALHGRAGPVHHHRLLMIRNVHAIPVFSSGNRPCAAVVRCLCSIPGLRDIELHHRPDDLCRRRTRQRRNDGTSATGRPPRRHEGGPCAPNPRPAMTSWRGSRDRTQGRAGATVRWVSVV